MIAAKRTLPVLIVFISIMCASASHATTERDCSSLVENVNVSASGKSVEVNEILVTGEDFYPLRVVLKSLDIDPKEVSSLRGKKVLSVGEGFSGLLPFFLKNKVDIVGLDIWYHRQDIPNNRDGIQMRAYNQKYKEHLVNGSTYKMPFRDNEFDVVVSHALIGNLGFGDLKVHAIEEMIRVTAPGGLVKVDIPQEHTSTEMILNQILRPLYGPRISIVTKVISVTWVSNKTLLKDERTLVTIRKNF